jgi:hypothetical protein
MKMKFNLIPREPNQLKVFWNNLHNRWTISKLLGLACLLLGLAGLVKGRILYLPIPGLAEFHQSISPTLFGAGIAVFLISWAIEQLATLATQEEKNRLILQMGSPDNAFAVEAVRMLSARKWLFDGTLAGASLVRTNLIGANLTGANLREADLLAANLRAAKLMGANLSGANLKSADLSGAKLSRADLSKAILINTNLSEAFLIGVDLHETDLQGADLSEAVLTGANLRGAINWRPEQFSQTRYLEGAIMPDGSMYGENDRER